MTRTNLPPESAAEERADAQPEPPGELRTLDFKGTDVVPRPLLVIVQRYVETMTVCVLNLSDALVVGRELGVGLRLRGTLVSRRHAMIRAAGSGIEIEDTSRNGTLVNGVPLHRGRIEVSGDCSLVIGSNRLHLRRL